MGERRLRILASSSTTTAPELETKRLCEVCAEVTGVSGAGIMLMSGDVPRGSVCTTDEVSTLDRAACSSSSAKARASMPTTRIARSWSPTWPQPATPRWLAFTGPAVEAGVRAIFGFPLQVGAVRLGALNLYRDRPGPLTDDQHADALVMADVAAQALLVMQANAPPGRLAAELEAGGDFQYVVHQASGMVVGPARRQRRPGPHPAAGPRLRQRPAPHRGGRGSSGGCASTLSASTTAHEREPARRLPMSSG